MITFLFKYRDKIVFAGAKPWDEIATYYQIGDVFVSASTSETQGLTFAEAMSAGLPVIAKNDKCIEGLISDNQTGFLYNTQEEFIEKTVHAMGRKHRVTVATSDGLEQVIILGQGGVRMSALGLKKQIESAGHEIREMCTTKSDSGKVYLFHETSDDVKKTLDEIRLEKNDKKNDKKIDIGKQGEK